MFKKILKNKSGYSLIEITLAIGVFAILGALTLHIFKATIQSQKSAIAGQNTQENLRYLFEVMSKEIRSARVCDSACGFACTNKIYNGTVSKLYFKNKDNECVTYKLDTNKIMIIRDGLSLHLTPQNIKITNLGFNIEDYLSDALPGDKIQPYVTISITAEANDNSGYKQPITMQTTVSSRHYE